MNDFTPLLRLISQKLEIPQPKKSRILLEIKADIEDSFEWFVSRGKTQKEALEAVREKFSPSEESIRELIAIHQSSVKGWLDHAPDHLQHIWERVLFLIIMALTLILGIRVILTKSLISQASIFFWPILIIGFAVAILGFVKIYKIFIKKDHEIRTLRDGLSWLLFLGGGALSFAAVGYYWELLKIGSINLLLETKLLYLISLQDDRFVGSVDTITNWLIRSSSMILGALIVALIAALLWFLLINKVIKIEIDEVEILMNPSSETN